MSFWPLFVRRENRVDRLMDQDFGMVMTPRDILVASPDFNMYRDYYRPWRRYTDETQVGSTIRKDKTKFQIDLDVQYFAPEEITVKTADGYVMVEGRHEEKKDQHGYISRQFTRKYMMPEDCNAELLQSKLSSDGVLTITAPRVTEMKNERTVTITQTGPVRKDFKDQISQATAANGAEK